MILYVVQNIELYVVAFIFIAIFCKVISEIDFNNAQ